MDTPQSPEEILSPCIPVECSIMPQASRPYRDGLGHFLKWQQGGNPQKIRDEFAFLFEMRGSGVTPRPLSCGPNYLLMEDLGDSEAITDSAKFSRSAGEVLRSLEAHNIRHRDLIAPNLIVRGNVIYIVDFGRAQWMADAVDERYLLDADMLVHTVALMTA